MLRRQLLTMPGASAAGLAARPGGRPGSCRPIAPTTHRVTLTRRRTVKLLRAGSNELRPLVGFWSFGMYTLEGT